MHKQKALKKFLAEFSWKIIFMDIAKFYIYLVLFYGLAILMVWGHAHWSLEASKISLDEMVSNIFATDSKEFGFNLENYKWLGQQMGFYMFILVCFGVFFSVPPKSFKHVSAVTTIIFLINGGIFLRGSIPEYFYDFCMLAGFALMPWLLSLAWNEHTLNQKNPTFLK